MPDCTVTVLVAIALPDRDATDANDERLAPPERKSLTDLSLGDQGSAYVCTANVKAAAAPFRECIRYLWRLTAQSGRRGHVA